MPPPQTDRRPDALDWAGENDWKHEETTSFDGEVIRDVFKKDDMELRCFWLNTPFSDAMWARGYFRKPYQAVTVPRVTSGGTRPSVETILKGQHKLSK